MKVIKVYPKFKEDVMSYIRRIAELQKEASSDELYIGEYIDTENMGNRYYFQGNDLPAITDGVDYSFQEHGPGLLLDHYFNTSIQRDNGAHYYTYHTYHGFITSDELNACLDENPETTIANVKGLGDKKALQNQKVQEAWYAKEIAQAKKEKEMALTKNQKDGIELLDSAIKLGDKLTDEQIVFILSSLYMHCIPSEEKHQKELSINDNPVFSSKSFAELMNIVSKRHQPDDIGYENPNAEELEHLIMWRANHSPEIYLRPGIIGNGKSRMDAFLSRTLYDYNNKVQKFAMLGDFSYECLFKLKSEELNSRDEMEIKMALMADGYGETPKNLKNRICGNMEIVDAEI